MSDLDMSPMTETHEPITRWECYDPHEIGELADGEFVRYADHIAAVHAARAEVVTVDFRGDYDTGYHAGLIEGDTKGRREGKRIGEAAMLARAIEAVAELTEKGDSVRPGDVMYVLRALKEKP